MADHLDTNIETGINVDNANNTDDCGDEFVFTDVGSTNAAFVSAAIFSVVGTILNLINISSILLYKRTRRHVTTPFIVSVAVSDLLFSSFLLPIFATRFYNRSWYPSIGEKLCSTFPLMFYSNSGASLLSLMVVTLNRACMLFFPNSVDKIFTRNVNVKGHLFPVASIGIIFLCWAIPFCLVFPAVFGEFGKMDLKIQTQSCTIVDDHHGRNPKRTLYAVGFFLPLAVILTSNFCIWMKIRVMKSESEGGATSTEKRFMLMLFIVVLVFLLTFSPGYAIKASDKCYKRPGLHIFGYILNWASVWLNPIIIIVSCKKYQYAIKDLFKKLTCCKSKREDGFSSGGTTTLKIRVDSTTRED